MPIINLPAYYKTWLTAVLRFSSAALIIGLLTGVMYQESAKKVPLSLYPWAVHFYANYDLSLIHGHVIQLGVVIPLAAMAMVLLPVVLLEAQPVSARMMQWIFGIYLPSAVWSLGLLLYKAYAIQLGIRGGQTDFNAIDQHLFGGNAALRYVIYAIPHSLMGLSMLLLAVAVWKSCRFKIRLNN